MTRQIGDLTRTEKVVLRYENNINMPKGTEEEKEPLIKKDKDDKKKCEIS